MLTAAVYLSLHIHKIWSATPDWIWTGADRYWKIGFLIYRGTQSASQFASQLACFLSLHTNNCTHVGHLLGHQEQFGVYCLWDLNMREETTNGAMNEQLTLNHNLCVVVVQINRKYFFCCMLLCLSAKIHIQCLLSFFLCVLFIYLCVSLCKFDNAGRKCMGNQQLSVITSQLFSELIESNHNSIIETKAMASHCSFCSSSSPKNKEFQFTLTGNNRKEAQFLTVDKLKHKICSAFC